MNIFNTIDYRKNIKFLIQERKKYDKKYTLLSISEAVRIQTPYLSRAINGKVHLSSDQLFLLSEYLNLSSDETLFLEYSLEYERSSLKKRKEKYLGRIKEIQEKYSDIQTYLPSENLEVNQSDQMEYYLDPLNLIVHMAILLPQYKDNLGLLETDLGLKKSQLNNYISRLLNLNLIELYSGTYKNTKRKLHLTKDSPINKPHRTLLRHMVNEHMMRKENSSDDSSISITYTGDQNTKTIIHREFLVFLKKIDPVIDEAPAENVYQLNFDLFPWL